MLLTQISHAQLEAANNYLRKIFSEQSVDTINVNLDSLMLDSIIIEHKNSQSIPGIATLIVKDNEVIWNKNYGYRNLQNQLPVEDSTIFYTASISKTIVATTIMQLWENGLIELENNINNYLPAGFSVANPFYPNATITVKMILTHTSSLQDNWNLLNGFNICGDSPIRLDSFLVKYFMAGGTYYSTNNFNNYPPGQQYNYTNAGASLLALMVENLTGKSFDEYCRDSIFIPLSMNTTSWFLEGMNVNNIATPYLAPTSPICHQGWPLYPVATLRTNKLELSNFLLAYLNNGAHNNYRILDSTTIAYMLSDHIGYLVDGVITQGLIWFKFYPIYTIWGHNGGWNGAETYMGFDPLEKYGVIWFQNWCENNFPYVRLIEIQTHFTKYAHLYGNIYAFKPEVDKGYARMGIDNVLFRTTFSNRYNHQFNANLIYAESDGTILDSIELYDDGLHGDSLSNDGIYGEYIPPQQTEDFYSLGVSTLDNITNKYFYTPDIHRFTTAGPVTLDSISYRKGLLNYHYVRPFVHNWGTVKTIPNATLKIICKDPWVASIGSGSAALPNIEPSASVGISSWITISVIDSLFPGYFNFKIEVMSDGFTYWVDSTQLIITGVEDEVPQPLTFKLEQNYPNPFNPSTKISWQSPIRSQQTLKVFDLLGSEVKTLIDEEKEAGYHSIDFNASDLPSGVYFYQLKAGNFIETKKMVYIR